MREWTLCVVWNPIGHWEIKDHPTGLDIYGIIYEDELAQALDGLPFDAKEELEKPEKERVELEQEVQELESQLEDLHNDCICSEELAEDYRYKYNNLEEECNELKEEVRALTEEVEDLEDALEVVEQDKKDWVNRCTELEAELEKLKGGSK